MIRKFLALAALAAIAASAQQSTTLTVGTPSGISNLGYGVSGTPGATQACYYVASNFVGGTVLSANPLNVPNVPNTLSGSNFIILSWQPAPGVVTQDVLKTATTANGSCVAPVSGASIALSTGLGPTVTTANDQGGALSPYTLSGFTYPTATVTLVLNNRDFTLPTVQILGNPNPPLSIAALGLTTGPNIDRTTTTDTVYVVPLGSCGLNATTGAFDTATTITGVNPGPRRTAAGNWVLQGFTTAAANAIALDCDIDLPSRLTAGRGVTINNIQLFYGVQTTTLTSITPPVANSVTYPATGAAAGATVAAAGGSLTITPGTLQLATTTSGQCYSENISFGTPIVVNTDRQRITLEQVFNQSAAAVTTLQICGVLVHFTNTPL